MYANCRRCSLAMGNLVRVLAHTYAVSLVRSEVLYSFLEAAKARLTEADIDMIVALLGSVGMQLRNEDPAAMKEFVLGVHSRAAELGAQGVRAAAGCMATPKSLTQQG
eukprot:359258-Chlamydomonas_euryale.AAC.6